MVQWSCDRPGATVRLMASGSPFPWSHRWHSRCSQHRPRCKVKPHLRQVRLHLPRHRHRARRWHTAAPAPPLSLGCTCFRPSHRAVSSSNWINCTATTGPRIRRISIRWPARPPPRWQRTPRHQRVRPRRFTRPPVEQPVVPHSAPSLATPEPARRLVVPSERSGAHGNSRLPRNSRRRTNKPLRTLSSRPISRPPHSAINSTRRSEPASTARAIRSSSL